jgi:hypothetical protein
MSASILLKIVAPNSNHDGWWWCLMLPTGAEGSVVYLYCVLESFLFLRSSMLEALRPRLNLTPAWL